MALAKKKGVLDGWYESRKEVIDYWHNLSNYVAKKRLDGISSFGPEDFKIFFAIDSGALPLPKENASLWDPDAYLLGRTNPVAKKRGLFNPHVMFGTGNVDRGTTAAGRSRSMYTQEDPFSHVEFYRDTPNWRAGWSDDFLSFA